MEEKVEVIDLFKVYEVLKKNIVSIVIWGVLGLAVAIGYSNFWLTPKYSATIDLLVSQKSDAVRSEYTTQQSDLQAINTYKDFLTKSVVLSTVADELKKTNNYQGSAGSLQGQISITNQANSQIMSVTVTDTNAYMAADIANTVGKVFSQKVKSVLKVDNVAIVTKAKPNLSPVSPNKKKNAIVGLVVGLLIGCVIAILKFMTDKTIKDPRYLTDESEELKLTNLGLIYHIKDETEGLGAVEATASHSGNKVNHHTSRRV